MESRKVRGADAFGAVWLRRCVTEAAPELDASVTLAANDEVADGVGRTTSATFGAPVGYPT